MLKNLPRAARFSSVSGSRSKVAVAVSNRIFLDRGPAVNAHEILARRDFMLFVPHEAEGIHTPRRARGDPDTRAA
jgi:hypothetical protein